MCNSTVVVKVGGRRSRLTIPSTRSRFAARFNSGVRPCHSACNPTRRMDDVNEPLPPSHIKCRPSLIRCFRNSCLMQRTAYGKEPNHCFAANERYCRQRAGSKLFSRSAVMARRFASYSRRSQGARPRRVVHNPSVSSDLPCAGELCTSRYPHFPRGRVQGIGDRAKEHTRIPRG